MKEVIKFTIIIPAYNVEKFIIRTLESVFNQTYKNFEVLVIDDCSCDNTLAKLAIIKDKRLKIIKNQFNLGPGIARNIGIEKATGNWILFLDADDELEPFALDSLYDFILKNKVKENELIAYNWKYKNQKSVKFEGRYDFNSLKKSKLELIKDFILLGMDGSVIYTLFPKKFLQENIIKFEKGFHEDIYFIFKSYVKSKKIYILDKRIYKKFNRENSIINSISKAHIDGYINAFLDIYKLLNEENLFEYLRDYFILGLINIMAVEIQNIWKNSDENSLKMKLYKYLYKKFKQIEYIINFSLIEEVERLNKNTKYFMIVRFFLNHIFNENLVLEMDLFLKNISKKSWSCYDLHNSLFLSYYEIRTCCKRFFDNGVMKGDVVLINTDKQEVTLDNILQSKQDLYFRINKGEAYECQNCPFLEFKEWGYIDKLNIEHLSLEYHSLCNMKCIYCSEHYYGGKKANYDVKKLLNELIINKALKNVKTIVWGGGEPTLVKDFEYLLNFIVQKIPQVKVRIITNATKYIPLICDLLKNDKIMITTSIDAGTEDTFFKIRKSKLFLKVFSNLKKYNKCDAKNNITIKYIILEKNKDLKNIENFVKLIKKFDLINCNFQISYNFKKQKVDIDSVVSMVVLYGLLANSGVNVVFLDDLIRQRLKINEASYQIIHNKLKEIGYDKFLFDPNKNKEIVIWGAGEQTKSLINNSYLLKKVKISYIVDDFVSKEGIEFLGYPVYSSEKLKKDTYPIIVSASQSTPLIIKKFKTLGISENRLVNGLIL